MLGSVPTSGPDDPGSGMASSPGGGVREVLQAARPATLGDDSATGQARALLEAIDTVLHGRRQAVYVSTPITTGPQFLDWWRANSDRVGSDHAAYQREMASVIEHNISAVRPLVDRVEARFQVPVIDPTRLDSMPGWDQSDYHRFWVSVIEKFVTTVVFADGWAFSSGCAVEFAAASDQGLAILDANLDVLPPAAGRAALDSAIRTIEDSGLDASAQRSAVATLDRLSQLGTAS